MTAATTVQVGVPQGGESRMSVTADVAGPIVDYLTEQRRQQHIAHDVLLRQQLQLRHDHVEGWRAESVAREIRDAETVERWLDRALRDLGVRS